MEKLTSLKAQILPVQKLEVTDCDKDGNAVTKTFSLVLDYNAIAKATEATGRDLAKIENWHELSGTQMSAVLWASFDRFHPEVTIQEVRRYISPADHWMLFGLLVEAGFPGFAASVIKTRQEEEAQKKMGGDQPSVPVAASV